MKTERTLQGKNLDGTPGEIRTPDPLLRRQVLYPAELRAHSRYAAHPALYTFGLTSVKAGTFWGALGAG